MNSQELYHKIDSITDRIKYNSKYSEDAQMSAGHLECEATELYNREASSLEEAFTQLLDTLTK